MNLHFTWFVVVICRKWIEKNTKRTRNKEEKKRLSFGKHKKVLHYFVKSKFPLVMPYGKDMKKRDMIHLINSNCSVMDSN